MLHRKTAISTGSTGGIGLGVARVRASQGANMLQSGFGEAAAIDGPREELAAQHRLKVGNSGADMARPAEVRGMVARVRGTTHSADDVVTSQ